MVGGVDTHLKVHVASVINHVGQVLGTEPSPAGAVGYRQLLAWLASHGRLVRVGVEGTGSYGARLTRHLIGQGVEVVEVNRPNRQRRRLKGQSDSVDAESAARAVLSGDATSEPKNGDGEVEGLRALRIARRSAIKVRTQAALQIRDLILTAPDKLRARLEPLTAVERAVIRAGFRPGESSDRFHTIKLALWHLGRHYQSLTIKIEELDSVIAPTCARINSALLGVKGVGLEVAATLLVVAGDDPQRVHSEAAFAAVCGVSPIEASSGRVSRHRLNRGGNRQGNNALWRIVIVRMANDPRTKAYVERKTQEGKTKKEIVRCLKRYVAREIHGLLVHDHAAINGADLRQQRLHQNLALHQAADGLNTWPIALSRLEREITHNTDLANRYQHWLNQAA